MTARVATSSDNLRGAGLMIGSMAAFTFNDLCIKAMGAAIPLSQILVLRGVLACVAIYLLARHLNALAWPEQRMDRAMILLRAVAETGAAFFFLTALRHMPFANVTAILQTLPLTVTLGAGLVFRDPVGWRRWLAIAVGFVGVLFIVQPGTDGFSEYTAFVLIAVLCVTVRDLSVRKMSDEVPSMTVTLVSAVLVTVFSGAVSLGVTWQPVTQWDAVFLLMSVGFIIVAYIFSVAVMRVGDVSFVAPFRFSALLWALVLGFVFFGEWPDQWTFLGAAIVVGAGVFTLYRERMAQR